MEHVTITQMEAILLRENKKWLLIGAGRLGRGLSCKLAQLGKPDICDWVDEKYRFFRLCGLPISSPDALSPDRYEGVIVSSAFSLGFYNVLCHHYPLEGLPVYVMHGEADAYPDYSWTNPKYTDIPVSDASLQQISPQELLRPNRLDIVIRYMACRELMAEQPALGVQLYEKLTLSMNGGSEYVQPFTTCSFFSDYEKKNGTAQFVEAFTTLIHSMEKHGFSKKHYIPLSEDGGVINGTHRIAVALALGKTVYVRKFVGYGAPFLTFSIAELKKIGYTDQEVDTVLNTYQKIIKEREK